MKKTILTSAVVAAVFGFGMDANAEHAGGKTAAHTPGLHSHIGSSFKAYPKKDDRGEVKYQPETYKDYKGDVSVDADGRAYVSPHWDDKAMDDEVGSPMGSDDRYDPRNAPTVK